MRLDITLTEATVLMGLLQDEVDRLKPVVGIAKGTQRLHLESRLLVVNTTLNNLNLEMGRTVF